MKVLSAAVMNFNRVYVTGIRKIDYKPKNKKQMLLGINGSGKSSFLSELIPTTIDDKSKYDIGGYREVSYLLNNKVYTLKYDRDTNRYSFIINGEEQNEPGLVKIQKQLIEREFRIDKDVHDLITSNISFTDMSINERKKWFTNILTNVDYDYALSVYNNAKVRNRELRAYLKLTKSKVISDEKLLSNTDSETIKILKSNISGMNTLLESLIGSKRPYRDINNESIVSDFERALKASQGYLRYLDKLDFDIKTVDRLKIETESKKDSLLNRKDELDKQLEEMDDLKISESDDKISLTKEVEGLEKEISLLKEENYFNLNLDRISEIYQEFKDITFSITDIVSELSMLEEYYKFLPDLPVLKEELNNLDRRINSYRSKVDSIEVRVKEMDTMDKEVVECPKCDHSWIPNFNLDLLKRMKLDIEDLNKNINSNLDYKKELEDKVNKLVFIEEQRRLLKGKFSNFTLPILTKMLEESDNLDSPGILNQMMTRATVGIENLLRYNGLKSKLKEAEDTLRLFNRLDSDTLKNLYKDLDKVKDEFTNTIREINHLNEKLNVYKETILKRDKLVSLSKELKNLIIKNKEAKKNFRNDLENKYINKVIYSLKRVISEDETKLIEIETLKDRYEGYIKEFNSYEKSLYCSNILIDMLSPNKGIIGKSLMSTINDIIEKMNEVISNIWSYDMTIMSTDIDDKDLTFKFPVIVNNGKPIPDVSKGSKGIMDVINLSFKLVAMDYLKMLDYPLVLDEFGTHMDEQHTLDAYNHIDDISEDYFSQVFVVTHFSSMYSRFTNVDINVLGVNGISIDDNEKINEVMKIE